MDKAEFYRLLSFLHVSPYRQQILQVLNEKGKPVRPSDIAATTDIRRNHISTNLQKMEEKGLVTVLNPESSSHRYYELTKKGREFITEAQQHGEEFDWLNH